MEFPLDSKARTIVSALTRVFKEKTKVEGVLQDMALSSLVSNGLPGFISSVQLQSTQMHTNPEGKRMPVARSHATSEYMIVYCYNDAQRTTLLQAPKPLQLEIAPLVSGPLRPRLPAQSDDTKAHDAMRAREKETQALAAAKACVPPRIVTRVTVTGGVNATYMNPAAKRAATTAKFERMVKDALGGAVRGVADVLASSDERGSPHYPGPLTIYVFDESEKEISMSEYIVSRMREGVDGQPDSPLTYLKARRPQGITSSLVRPTTGPKVMEVTEVSAIIVAHLNKNRDRELVMSQYLQDGSQISWDPPVGSGPVPLLSDLRLVMGAAANADTIQHLFQGITSPPQLHVLCQAILKIGRAHV